MCRKFHCQSLIPLNIFCLNCAFKLKSCIFSYFACGFRNDLAYRFINVLLSELTSFVRPYLLLSSVIYIWDGLFYQFHLGRGHIGASMKANLYHLLEHRAAEW